MGSKKALARAAAACYVAEVDIEQVFPDPANAMKHDGQNIAAIKGSLARFGQQKPIVVDKNMVVRAGNGTLEAAKALGWKKILIMQSKLEGSEMTAYALADNRTAQLAAWDDEILGKTLQTLRELEFPIEDIGFEWEEPEPEVELSEKDDEVPEVEQNKFGVKLGDIWLLGEHRLMCGDSTSKEHTALLFAGGIASLCFTSPPYADQRDYRGGKELSTEHLATFIDASKENVPLYAVNLGLSRKENEVNQYWDDYIKRAREGGLKFLSWNVWDKGECGSIGNQTAMFGICHEWILVFGRERKRLNRTVKNKSAGELANHDGNRQKDGSIKKQKDRIVSEKSQLKTVLSLTPQKARDWIDHPARFPVEFPLAYIEACTDPGQWVYEPFCGSGSTLIACEKTGRKCYGMELDPHYCSVIIERWQNLTGKKAERG